MNIITQLIEHFGLSQLAGVCGVTYQAVRKWERRGCLPRSEWTGETEYASKIATASAGVFTAEQLLSHRPTSKAA